MRIAFFSIFASLILYSGCASKKITRSDELLPFRSTVLTGVQIEMVDGCTRTVDPNQQLSESQRRDFCACTVVNQAKMFEVSPSASDLDQTRALQSNQDLCRCAVGLKPIARKSCE